MGESSSTPSSNKKDRLAVFSLGNVRTPGSKKGSTIDKGGVDETRTEIGSRRGSTNGKDMTGAIKNFTTENSLTDPR